MRRQRVGLVVLGQAERHHREIVAVRCSETVQERVARTKPCLGSLPRPANCGKHSGMLAADRRAPSCVACGLR